MVDINLAALAIPGLKIAGDSTLDFANNAVTGLFRKVKSSLAKTPKFQYGDYIERDHLRLIRFVEDSSLDLGQSDLVMALETYPIGPKCPPFVAISYTWGRPELVLPGTPEKYAPVELRPSWVNRARLDLTPNLHDCLSQLRKLHPPGTYFWADAVCINQQNKQEIAQQMGIMDLVYSRSWKTVVWLGKKTSTTADAISLLSRDAEAVKKGALQLLESQVAGRFQEPISVIDTTPFWQFGITPIDMHGWKTLSDIFSRRWFGRCWMVQEVALSKNVEVLCGDLFIGWDTIAWFSCFIGLSHTAITFLQHCVNDLKLGMTAMGMIYAVSLHLVRLWYQGPKFERAGLLKELDFSAGMVEGGPGSVLMKLIIGSNGFSSSERRDRMYAFHGILHAMTGFDYKTHPHFMPDYADSTSDAAVIERVVKAMIEESGALHPVSLAGEAGYNLIYPRLYELPSWIPDFQGARQHMPLLGASLRRTREYDASGRKLQVSSGSSSFLFDPANSRKVWVSGVNLGPITFHADSWESMSLRHRFQKSVELLTSVPYVYAPTGQNIIEVFWRTLCTDSDMASRPAHDELATYFREWFGFHVFTALMLDLVSPKNIVAKPTEALEDFFRLNAGLEELARRNNSLVPSQAELRSRLADIGHRAAGLADRKALYGAKEYTANWKRASERFEVFGLYYANYKKVFATARGYMGSGHQSLQAGQTVWVLAGCPTPMVLRPDGQNPACYRVVGDAYVHGVMFGESISTTTKWDRICLV
jgi:hypothetical protein